MDGRETLQVLKADPAMRGIPVVVWTTSRSEDDLRRARAAGCDDYIVKPSSFTEMVGIVRNLGERWLAAAQNGAAT
jgi:CheY-like chemotaxis protein